MKAELWIPGKLPGLNEIIASARSHKMKSASQKKKYTTRIAWYAKVHLNPIQGKFDICFTWNERNRRRDPDNIAVGQKFVLDGLVLANIIPNDGWNQINSIVHRFEVNEEVGVRLTIIEVI